MSRLSRRPLIKPPAIRAGDRLRVVAPASPFDRDRLARGVAEFERLGFHVDWRPDLFDRDGFLAGSDARRADELTEAFLDPQISGIVCARGGYGSMRLLPRLDLPRLAASPKVLLGFSDVTALLLAFLREGLVTFHGPVVTGRMAEVGLEPAERDAFRRAVMGPSATGVLGEGRALVGGVADGPLVGGTLSLIVSLLGTPWFPELDGAILFLEEVGEKPFRVDRMLTQLDLAGVFSAVAGVALGRFSRCDNPADPSVPVESVLASRFRSCGKPVLAGLPFGHDGENRTLPVGIRARLDADAGRLVAMESAVTLRADAGATGAGGP